MSKNKNDSFNSSLNEGEFIRPRNVHAPKNGQTVMNSIQQNQKNEKISLPISGKRNDNLNGLNSLYQPETDKKINNAPEESFQIFHGLKEVPNLHPNLSNKKNFFRKKIFFISYNEEEQDFNIDDLAEIKEKIKQNNPTIIIICTQKSKSTGNKHFSHVLGEYLKSGIYKLIYKKNASTKLSTITYNNNVRTRIYLQNNVENIMQKRRNNSYNITNNLSKTINQGTKSTLGRSAICTTINDLSLIIVNTELFSDDFNNSNSSNNFTRTNIPNKQQEFYNLVLEFELHKKYNEGYNIIFCGSLNFRLSKSFFSKLVPDLGPGIENIHNCKEVKNKIIAGKNTKNIKNLINYNKLKMYLNQMKNSKDVNSMLKTLFQKFSESIKQIGFVHNCSFCEKNSITPYKRSAVISNAVLKGPDLKTRIKGLGEGIAEVVRQNVSSTLKKIISNLKSSLTQSSSNGETNINSSGNESSNRTNTVLENRAVITYPNLSHNIKRKIKLPAMCDKILFALHNENELENKNTLSFINFEVLNSIQNYNRRIICATFDIIFPAITISPLSGLNENRENRARINL